MARKWVLDTETKGTGAQMVPLEPKQDTGEVPLEPILVRRDAGERTREPSPAPEPRQPPRFKVVDVTTQQVLTEGAATRATVEALKAVQHVVDVRIYTWDDERERWRLLTLAEQQALWSFRDA